MDIKRLTISQDISEIQINLHRIRGYVEQETPEELLYSVKALLDIIKQEVQDISEDISTPVIQRNHVGEHNGTI